MTAKGVQRVREITKKKEPWLWRGQHLIGIGSALLTLCLLIVMYITYDAQKEFGGNQLELSRKLTRLEDIALSPQVYPVIDSIRPVMTARDTVNRTVDLYYHLLNKGGTAAREVQSSSSFSRLYHPENTKRQLASFGEGSPVGSIYPEALVSIHSRQQFPETQDLRRAPKEQEVAYLTICYTYVDHLARRIICYDVRHILIRALPYDSTLEHHHVNIGIGSEDARCGTYEHSPSLRALTPEVIDSLFPTRETEN